MGYHQDPRSDSAAFCRQRKHISQLEQKVRESELQVHSALLGRPAPFGDVCLLRLQVSVGSYSVGSILFVITVFSLELYRRYKRDQGTQVSLSSKSNYKVPFNVPLCGKGFRGEPSESPNALVSCQDTLGGERKTESIR